VNQQRDDKLKEKQFIGSLPLYNEIGSSCTLSSTKSNDTAYFGIRSYAVNTSVERRRKKENNIY